MKQYYLQHYFNFQNAGLFFLVAIVGLIAVLAIIIGYARFSENKLKKQYMDERRRITREEYFEMRLKPVQFIESFYEMVFSSTSILLFLAIYYIIDEHMPQVAPLWEKYQSVLLLVFIMMSVVMTAWMDMILVKLTHIRSEQKASVRLVSSIYIVLILLYIKFIYNDNNYDELVLYFVTLAVGRFIFFDFTVKDFMNAMRGVVKNLPLLGLMLLYSAIVCWYGFHVQFLLKSNGVIISTLIAHIFMDISIFFVHKTKIMRRVL